MLRKFGIFFGGALATVFVGFFALFVLLMAALIWGDAGEPQLEAAKTSRGVGIVPIEGEISSSTQFGRNLKRMLESDAVKAIVVRVDSPGGSVGPSEEMFRLIRDARAKKPVVCSMGDVAASGGLYASMGCQKIVANAGTLTGSIGVIIAYPQVYSLVEKLGVQMTIVKSGKHKDTGSPFRAFNDDDRALTERLIQRAFGQFVKVVAESRGLPEETVRQFADGRIILGDEAVELKLVDQIGGLEDAAKLALSMTSETGEPELIRFKVNAGMLGSMAESKALAGRLIQTLSGRGRMLYLSQF